MREIVKSQHPDDYTLLRHLAGELDELGRRRVEKHVEGCRHCLGELQELRWIDEHLTTERDVIFGPGEGSEVLPDGDPFRDRPVPAVRRLSDYGLSGPSFPSRCLLASDAAHALSDEILAADAPALARLLSLVDFEELRDRYGLGFALDEAPRRMAEGAIRYRPLAELTLGRLGRERVRPFADMPRAEVTEAECAYPLIGIAARAHLLDGIICNWTGEFDRGGGSFERAWKAFAGSADTELAFAGVEKYEAERRTFTNDPRSGLILAERARRPFEEMRCDDDAARAAYSIGMALAALNRDEEALAAFRGATEVFERSGLWSVYVTGVNAIGAQLMKLGRLAEAKREFARALRLTASGARPGCPTFIRTNLAITLFRAGQYASALSAFRTAVRLWEEQKSVLDALATSLYVVECLARTGRLGAARQHLRGLEARIAAEPGLDPAVLRAFADELSSDRPDFEAVSSLRDRAEDEIRSLLRRA